MDIYELRAKMNVYNFGLHQHGATIFYKIDGRYGNVCLDHETLFKELKSIGSVDDVDNWDESIPLPLSQWDALNIAIRFEHAREMDKEIGNSDISKAINNLNF